MSRGMIVLFVVLFVLIAALGGGGWYGHTVINGRVTELQSLVTTQKAEIAAQNQRLWLVSGASLFIILLVCAAAYLFYGKVRRDMSAAMQRMDTTCSAIDDLIADPQQAEKLKLAAENRRQQQEAQQRKQEEDLIRKNEALERDRLQRQAEARGEVVAAEAFQQA